MEERVFLKRLRLENFRKFGVIDFEFSKNVNVLVGPSNIGKSVVIKALRWFFLNEPKRPGIKIKKRGTAKKAPVSVKGWFSDGNVVERLKKPGFNGYILNEEMEFSPINLEIPEEIRRVLFLDPLMVQTQFDPYFFIDGGPSQIVKTLNDLYNFGIVDKVINVSKRRVSKARQDISLSLKKINEIKKEIEELFFVDNLEQQILSLEKSVAKRKKLKIRIRKFEKIKDENEKVMDDLKKLSLILDAKEEVEAAEMSLKKRLSIIKEIRSAEKLAENYKNVFLMLSEVKKRLEIKSWYSENYKRVFEIRRLSGEIFDLTILSLNYSKFSDDLKKRDREIKILKKKRKNILLEIKKCPVCGKDVCGKEINLEGILL